MHKLARAGTPQRAMPSFFPLDLHRALKRRAEREGRTMSELVLEQLPRIASNESAEALIAELRSRSAVGGSDPVALIRADRDAE